jgi:hypothetical protein
MYLLPCDQKWGGKPLEFLMQNHSPVEKPSVELGIGSALAQVDFSRSPPSKNADNFGLKGMAFIAEFGIMVPISHLPRSLESRERNCRTKSGNAQSTD